MPEEVTGYSEVREVKTYFIKAKTKADAEKVLKLAINSQDEIERVVGKRWGYEAQVSCLIARDWPSNQGPG